MTPHDMAKKILDMEARRDRYGNLEVYFMPPNDGGGKFEVAGINEKFDPNMAPFLAWLVNHKRFEEAESTAISYIEFNTDGVRAWGGVSAIQYVLRDIFFNRGPGGAAKILQMALRVSVDGNVGPRTKYAVTQADPKILLARLRTAREDYERTNVGYRANLWQGLINRFNKVHEVAKAELA